MQRRIDIQHNKLLEIFAEIQKENQVLDQSSLERDIRTESDKMLLLAQEQIVQKLSNYNSFIKEKSKQEKPITAKMKQCISELITTGRYTITEEELQRAKNQENTDSATILTAEYSVRGVKYKSMYDEFIDNIVNLAVEEYKDSENALLTAFNEGLGLTPAHPCYNELEDAIKEYIAERCHNSAPEGYYSSLIRRYSGNLFSVLIRQPFSEDSRYTVFDQERRNFYSLSLFGANDQALSIRPDVQPMHAQILYHEQLVFDNDINSDDTQLQQMVLLTESKINEPVAVGSELYQLLSKMAADNPQDAIEILNVCLNEIKNTNRTNEGLPLFAITPNPLRIALTEKLKNRLTTSATVETTTGSPLTSEEYYRDYFHDYKMSKHKDAASIAEEFTTDVKILSTILNQQVMNAIDIEVPFLDLVEQNVTTLKASLQGLAFVSFFHDHEEKLMKEEFDRLQIENEIKQKRADILKEIEQIIDMKGE